MTTDEQFMQRCIELARNGAGTVSPNPMVGAVVVHDSKIIGEGWHRKAGEPHAEVHAINAVKDQQSLRKSTVYVSLEPCSHFGKTPPCSDLLVEKQVKRVVVGCTDPNPEVAGKGIEKLIRGGIEVVEGVLEKDCRHLNAKFFTFHQRQRPFITLKWAQTADGYMDKQRSADERGSFPISGKLAQVFVHKMRTEHDAILIGRQTAFIDNPGLSSRVFNGKSPRPLILDRHNKLPKNLKVLQNPATKHFVLKENVDESFPSIPISSEAHFILEVLSVCYKMNIQSVLVEGGAVIHQAFLNQDLWDELVVLESKQELQDGLKAPQLLSKPIKEEKLGEDQLKFYRHVSGS